MQHTIVKGFKKRARMFQAMASPLDYKYLHVEDRSGADLHAASQMNTWSN